MTKNKNINIKKEENYYKKVNIIDMKDKIYIKHSSKKQSSIKKP
jgi:hypothetical protein